MSRKVSDWIEGFETWSTGFSSAPILCRWTGISIVAAALERKVWTDNAISHLYPNLYVFLMGPPASGKTIMTTEAWHTIKALKNHKISSSSVTRATIIEELNAAERFVQTSGSTVKFNSLYVLSNEIGVLIPAYEMEFLNKLTDIYDAKPYSESRRDKRHNVQIEKPLINMLAAGTPGYLGSIIPEVAWEQGFLSRVNIIYSGQIKKRSLWAKVQTNETLKADLLNDLLSIGVMRGEMRYTQEAAELIDNFYMEVGDQTAPLHPKLNHYNSRRTSHMLKLMMVSAASARDELVVEASDYHRALAWMLEAEESALDAFKAMGGGGDSQTIRDAWHFLFETYVKNKKAIPESRLINFLSQRAPSEKIPHIIDLMIKGELVRTEPLAAGVRGLIPVEPSND